MAKIYFAAGEEFYAYVKENRLFDESIVMKCTDCLMTNHGANANANANANARMAVIVILLGFVAPRFQHHVEKDVKVKLRSVCRKYFESNKAFLYHEYDDESLFYEQFFYLFPLLTSFDDIGDLQFCDNILSVSLKASTNATVTTTTASEAPHYNFILSLLNENTMNIECLQKFGRNPFKVNVDDVNTLPLTMEENIYIISHKPAFFTHKLLSKFQPSHNEKDNKKDKEDVDAAAADDDDVVVDEDNSKVPKVLVLHGFSQNGKNFKRKTKKLKSKKGNFLLYYIDAPHLAKLKNEIGGSLNDSETGIDKFRLAWYNVIENSTTTDDDDVKYNGILESLNYIRNVIASQGPFIGVIGFSQGAIMASLLLRLQQFRNEPYSFEFAVLIGGFIPRPPELSKYFIDNNKNNNNQHLPPSLHVIGRLDTLVHPDRSRKLFENFQQVSAANVLYHDGSHLAWATNSIACNNIINYVETQMAKSMANNLLSSSSFSSPTSSSSSSVLTSWSAPRLERISKTSTLLLNNKATDSELLSIVSDKSIMTDDVLHAILNTRGKDDEKYSALLAIIYQYYNNSNNNDGNDGGGGGESVLKKIINTLEYSELIGFTKAAETRVVSTEKLLNLVNAVVDVFVSQLQRDRDVLIQLSHLDDANDASQHNHSSQEEEEEEELVEKISECVRVTPRIRGELDKKFYMAKKIATKLYPPSSFNLYIYRDSLKTPLTDEEIAERYKIHANSQYRQLINNLSERLNQFDVDHIHRQTNLYSERNHMNQSQPSMVITQEMWDKMSLEPISTMVINPAPEPVIPCLLEQLTPLLNFLEKTSDKIDQEMVSFEKGTLTNDGRLDLCKQVVGPKGIDPLLNALKFNHNRIDRILLGNNIVTDSGARAIAKYISEDETAKQITTWYIAGNDITAEGISSVVDALLNNKVVDNLWLKRNPLKPEGAIQLARLLRVNNVLNVLDVTNCGLLDAGLKTIVESLQQNKTLQHLYLGANGITKISAKVIRDHLITGENHLKTLVLSTNRLEDAGCILISEGLKEDKNLERISLASNRLTEKSMLQLSLAVQSHPTLMKLDIGFPKNTAALREMGNRIKDEGAMIVAKNLISPHPYSKTTLLCCIDMIHNGITNTGIEAIANALSSNSRITNIVLDKHLMNKFDESRQLSVFIRAISEKCKQNFKRLSKEEQTQALEADLPKHAADIYSVYRTHSEK